MGNPDIKMALNENLTIGRQDGAHVRHLSMCLVMLMLAYTRCTFTQTSDTASRAQSSQPALSLLHMLVSMLPARTNCSQEHPGHRSASMTDAWPTFQSCAVWWLWGAWGCSHARRLQLPRKRVLRAVRDGAAAVHAPPRWRVCGHELQASPRACLQCEATPGSVMTCSPLSTSASITPPPFVHADFMPCGTCT